MIIRLFLANHRSSENDQTASQVMETRRLFEEAMPGHAISVTSGTEDWKANFSRAAQRDPRDGGWYRWTMDVATAQDPFTGEPRYHGIVLPDETVGKATAQIIIFCGIPVVGMAPATPRRPVYLIGGRGLCVVTMLEVINPKDRARGWRVQSVPLPGAPQAAEPQAVQHSDYGVGNFGLYEEEGDVSF